jgi:hypothetical protein
LPPAQLAVFAQVTVLTRAPVDVGPGIAGMGQRGVHRVIGGLDPGDLRGTATQVSGGLQRPAQALLAQPQPGRAHRPADGEALEHRGDHTGDRLVGVQPDLSIGLTPDQPDWQPRA